jgi:hypothetical protein
MMRAFESLTNKWNIGLACFIFLFNCQSKAHQLKNFRCFCLKLLFVLHRMQRILSVCNNFSIYHWQALGCLLYRICYLKSAFDGESKLQILNGNYRIPEQPKYSTAVTGLIRDMLEASPNARPDITQARALTDWPFISMMLG